MKKQTNKQTKTCSPMSKIAIEHQFWHSSLEKEKE